MKKLQLTQVTAICVDGRPLTEERRELYEKIVQYMKDKIDFYCIKMLLTEDPKIDGIDFVQIDHMPNVRIYDQFCLSEMHKHVDSDFCLIFQDDGFVINPELWRPIFLEYDYVGAPWPPLHPWPEPGRMDRRVGNGGFCLRSKKLLEAIKEFKAENNEDIIIVSTRRDELDQKGIKFAPMLLAADFSIECEFMPTQSMSSTFGFHHKARVPDALQIISKKS
jgi:hypothetical protein